MKYPYPYLFFHFSSILGVAPQIISNKEFAQAFGSALNRPSFFPTPEFVFNLVFGEERAVLITRGQKIEPKRALESGFRGGDFRLNYPLLCPLHLHQKHNIYEKSDESTPGIKNASEFNGMPTFLLCVSHRIRF